VKPAATRTTLDLRGIRCPLTWARAKVVLEERGAGDVVVLIVDDPRSVRDVPRAAEAAGHHVVDVSARGGVSHIAIEV
jgi:TusA-related sulfurtransferase